MLQQLAQRRMFSSHLNPRTLKGFHRLSHEWPQRQAMKVVLEEFKEKQGKTLQYYIYRNPWKRVAYSIILGLIYYYNLPKKIYDGQKNFRERQWKSYTARWLRYYSLEKVRHTELHEKFSIKNAVDKCRENYENGTAMYAFTEQQVQKLADLQFEFETELQYGFSRELIVRTLKNPSMIEKFGYNQSLEECDKFKKDDKDKMIKDQHPDIFYQLETSEWLVKDKILITKKQIKAFMVSGGYQGELKQKTSSMSLMPFIMFLQKQCFEDPEEFVNLFIEELKEEAKDIYRGQKLKDPSFTKTLSFSEYIKDEMMKDTNPELFKKIEQERIKKEEQQQKFKELMKKD